MRRPGSKPSPLFQLVIPATAIFIVTILSLIAIVFSDQRAPVAQWLNRYGNTLLVTEFAVVIFLSLLAMTMDRRQTLKEEPQKEPQKGTGPFNRVLGSVSVADRVNGAMPPGQAVSLSAQSSEPT